MLCYQQYTAITLPALLLVEQKVLPFRDVLALALDSSFHGTIKIIAVRACQRDCWHLCERSRHEKNLFRRRVPCCGAIATFFTQLSTFGATLRRAVPSLRVGVHSRACHIQSKYFL